MAEAAGSADRREVGVFTRYLVGRPPDEAVASAYARGLAAVPVQGTSWDRTLVAVARVHPAATRCADAYARFFARRGLLRHRLVLLAAILESRAPFAAAFDAPPPGSPVRVVLRLAWTGAVFMLAAAAGLLLLGPLHAAARAAGRA